MTGPFATVSTISPSRRWRRRPTLSSQTRGLPRCPRSARRSSPSLPPSAASPPAAATPPLCARRSLSGRTTRSRHRVPRASPTSSLRDTLRSGRSLFERRGRPALAAGALGLINFGGAAYLGSLLADLQSQLPPGMGRLLEELGALQDLYPFLAYAVAYVAVPAVRFLQLQRTNAEIDERNANRRAWRDQLRQGGDALKKRLQAAAQRKKTLRLVTEEEVSFDSSKDLAEQREEQTPGLDDFDRRLREASGGKGK